MFRCLNSRILVFIRKYKLQGIPTSTIFSGKGLTYAWLPLLQFTMDDNNSFPLLKFVNIFFSLFNTLKEQLFLQKQMIPHKKNLDISFNTVMQGPITRSCLVIFN